MNGNEDVIFKLHTRHHNENSKVNSHTHKYTQFMMQGCAMEK